MLLFLSSAISVCLGCLSSLYNSLQPLLLDIGFSDQPKTVVSSPLSLRRHVVVGSQGMRLSQLSLILAQSQFWDRDSPWSSSWECFPTRQTAWSSELNSTQMLLRRVQSLYSQECVLAWSIRRTLWLGSAAACLTRIASASRIPRTLADTPCSRLGSARTSDSAVGSCLFSLFPRPWTKSFPSFSALGRSFSSGRLRRTSPRTELGSWFRCELDHIFTACVQHLPLCCSASDLDASLSKL